MNLFKLFDSKVADVYNKRKGGKKTLARNKKMLDNYEDLKGMLSNLRAGNISLGSIYNLLVA